MFWSRKYKEVSEDGVAMLAGVLIVEATNIEEAKKMIFETEMRWTDAYCIGPVDGPYQTEEEAIEKARKRAKKIKK
ncbi:MAG: hypothetical protein HYT36_02295 [Candidatus Staskawiczbacteria bacterium]|nr:hypothetical protein [Candidatus Staskawiczbacteria bacterium]